jgi:phenylpyruvate tautomerase PptA (4-oxalocrotonate tautomerase family)
MPLARIDLPAGKSADYKRAVADVVYDAVVNVLKAPEGDRFQVITEHGPDTLLIDQHYFGIERSADAMIIQVTISGGRSSEMRQAFLKAVADGLHARVGVRTEDVMINLVETQRDNWSFGNGIAQYAVLDAEATKNH